MNNQQLGIIVCRNGNETHPMLVTFIGRPFYTKEFVELDNILDYLKSKAVQFRTGWSDKEHPSMFFPTEKMDEMFADEDVPDYLENDLDSDPYCRAYELTTDYFIEHEFTCKFIENEEDYTQNL